MKHLAAFLRFEGRLWENMTFDRLPRWETDRIAHRSPEGDGSYRLELLAEDEETLLVVSPLVDYSRVMPQSETGLRSTIVVAHIPTHPRGSELVFRYGEQVIHRERIAEDPPYLEIEGRARQKDGRIRLSWRAEHPTGGPLSFNVAYIVGGERIVGLVRGLTDRSYTVDVSELPGGPSVRLAVLATDGTRSSFALTEPFRVPSRAPRIWLQNPAPGELLPADQPISLRGQALDIIGAPLDEKGLIWRVDGKVVSRDRRLALAEGLEPGRHDVVLEYRPKRKLLAREEVSITIAERGDEQTRFLELMA